MYTSPIPEPPKVCKMIVMVLFWVFWAIIVPTSGVQEALNSSLYSQKQVLLYATGQCTELLRSQLDDPWLAGNEGMEKNMETTGTIGTDYRQYRLMVKGWEGRNGKENGNYSHSRDYRDYRDYIEFRG